MKPWLNASTGWVFGLLVLCALPIGPIRAEEEAKPAPVPAITDNVKDLFVEVAKRSVPSVVNVYTTQKFAVTDDFQKKLFEEFFGGSPNMPPLPKSRMSLGTGFIIDAAEGLILTNYHVIAQADSVKVLLAEDENENDSIKATIIGGDSEGDVALIKINPKDTKHKLVALPLGSSSKLQVGEWVTAIGNPFGLGSTVTKGIVSAKGRVFPMSQFANYIQTDAPINPGNSGGPLINTAGEVIGINTFINAAAQGIGFAIQIDYIKEILPDLRKNGSVTRGYIGIQISEITPEFAESLAISTKTKGVIVSDVHEGNEAEKAGVKPYDVITDVDGKAVTTSRQLIAAITAVKPGQKTKLRILRNGKEKIVAVKVASRPMPKEVYTDTGGKKGKKQNELDLGMELDELSSREVMERGLPRNVQGVIVRSVVPGSPADEAGLAPDNVIVEVDRKETPDLESFFKIVKEKRKYMIRFVDVNQFVLRTIDLSDKSGSKK